MEEVGNHNEDQLDIPESPNSVASAKMELVEEERRKEILSDMDQDLLNHNNSVSTVSCNEKRKQHQPLSTTCPRISEKETTLMRAKMDPSISQNQDLNVGDAHQPSRDSTSSCDESKADNSPTPTSSVDERDDADHVNEVNFYRKDAEALDTSSQQSKHERHTKEIAQIHAFDAYALDLDANGIRLCRICNMAFSSNLLLEIHEKRWHNEGVRNAKREDERQNFLNFMNSNRPQHLSDEDSAAADENQTGPNESSDDSVQDGESPVNVVKHEIGDASSPGLECSGWTSLGSDADADGSSGVMRTDGEAIGVRPMVSGKKSSNRRKPRKTTSSVARPFKCQFCGKNFRDANYLEVHVRTHTGEKPYQCGECLKEFSRAGHLMVHMRMHTGEKPFLCGECGKSFVRNDLLCAHMRIHTEADNPYTCHTCGKTFSDSNSVKRHLKTHSGEKPFICRECGSCFARNELLMVHMRMHTGEKPYSCDWCDKRFGNNSNLQIHLRTHTGEKPFKCKVCGKNFRRSGQVKIHMRVHTGERPFQCNQCGKHISSKDQLLIHIRTHTGEKPYSCSECGKSFCRNGQLQIHMRSHTGERPFVCLICDKGFSNKSSLTRHMKLHPEGEVKGEDNEMVYQHAELGMESFPVESVEGEMCS